MCIAWPSSLQHCLVISLVLLLYVASYTVHTVAIGPHMVPLVLSQQILMSCACSVCPLCVLSELLIVLHMHVVFVLLCTPLVHLHLQLLLL